MYIISKTFSTVNAQKNHENSKKHKENVSNNKLYRIVYKVINKILMKNVISIQILK